MAKVMALAAGVRTGCEGCLDGQAFTIPFSMAFQPIVDIESGGPFAYEALARGSEDEPAASVLDRVDDGNRYAFDQACRVKAIETSLAAGLLQTDARLSINFMPNAIYSPLACVQLTLKTAAATGFPLDRLMFEFTEQEHMESYDHVGAIIQTYRSLGFTVAIDDFGAGHSGLDRLARFPSDIIKLDMELVRGIDADPRRRAIVDAIAGLCCDLDTLLIAEGIETPSEAETLADLGVRYMQGFLFARPAFERLPEIQFRL